MGDPVHIISLGAGVQSSTMALMAACGEITPMPIAAIFADTQAEPASVYRWLDWLEKELPFPVHRVTKGNLSEEGIRIRVSKGGKKYMRTNLPYHTLNESTGSVGAVRQRTCTRDFKIQPLTKASRQLAGIKRGQKTIGVVTWIGISVDEFMRVRLSREKWSKHRWPLIEKNFTRQKCLEWMQDNGYPQPPRSACVFCPFHSNREWRRLQTEEPVEFERAVQSRDATVSTQFLHRSCKPLDTIDFRSDVEKGQGLLFDDNLQDECEGMCGV